MVETNARALIEVLRGIPKSRHMCLEEGTLSGWLHEVLEPHVEELVVTGVGKSRGPKSDKRDAFALAEQLRIGAICSGVCRLLPILTSSLNLRPDNPLTRRRAALE